MSNETEYTKGPWDWTIHDHSCASLGTGDDPGMGDPLVMSVSPCRSCIDRVKDGEWVWGRCTTPSEADARLIAAAPELLEALMAVEMARHTDAKEDWLKATALTEAAIVKATVRPK